MRRERRREITRPRARGRKLVLALACGVALAAGPAWGQAPGAPAPLNAAETMRDTLQRLQAAKKPVELVLRNGKTYHGNLGSVGDHAVIVTDIQGKEFFDAYIVMEDISAVEVRARER